MKPSPRLAFAAFALACLALPAQAQRAASTPSAETASASSAAPPPPPGFPAPLGGDVVVGGELETHFQADLTAAHASKTRINVFNDSDLSLFANYRSWLSLNADIKLERTRDDNLDSFFPSRNAVFNSEALTARQLYVTLRPVTGLSLYGGKIHPNFGSAYELAPGIYYNFGTDYEQDERIGFGAEYLLPRAFSADNHLAETLGLTDIRAALETFYLDTSFLSQTLISRPSLTDQVASRLSRFTRDQYGASNTGSFDSFTASLRGGKPERGLAWQVSLTSEATAAPDGRREFGQSIGASFDPSGDGIPLGNRLGVTPFLEYTHFTNFGGVAGLERHYAVGGLAFSYARWMLNAAAGIRRSSGLARATDHQENLSLTYQVIPRFQLGGGINFVNIDGRSSWTLSPSINYTRAF